MFDQHGMRPQAIPPILGMSFFFTFEYVCYCAGRSFVGLPLSLPLMLTANTCGVLAGSFLPFPAPVSSGESPAMPARRMHILALVYIGAGLAGALACFFGVAEHAFQKHFFAASALLAGIPLPFLLRLFFSGVPRGRQGFSLGLILATAEIFWIFLYINPSEILDPSVLGVVLGLLQLCTGALAAASIFRPAPRIAQNAPAPGPCARELALRTLLYLAAIASIFFMLDSIIDILFFRYDSVRQTIPREVNLYIWITYPFIGRLIDRQGAGIKFFLVCLAMCFVSPSLTIFSQGSPMYWLIFALDIVSRHGVLIFLTIVFAGHADRQRWPGLTVSTPYLLQHAAYVLMWLFFEAFHPGTAVILLVSLFLCCAFSFLSSRVHYALSLSGHDTTVSPTVTPKTETAPGPAVTAGGCAIPYQGKLVCFVEKYGLSARESDVLRLILDGTNTSAMSEHLHISESTVKSHVKSILRKTDTASRNVLMALFMNEG